MNCKVCRVSRGRPTLFLGKSVHAQPSELEREHNVSARAVGYRGTANTRSLGRSVHAEDWCPQVFKTKTLERGCGISWDRSLIPWHERVSLAKDYEGPA
jgi:hypothetical protein